MIKLKQVSIILLSLSPIFLTGCGAPFKDSTNPALHLADKVFFNADMRNLQEHRQKPKNESKINQLIDKL